ncbi:NAD-dependent epimerase/dehydratase family protein [Rothia sp. AR01]|uniref:NAD-dependent epimerase/dehydratase family protein n=1 Tax=Rothia santali TaxID=2949643 RepID=A0A9X2HDZ4_9MICC|nr:NAD-dependent epimerase/dehydratase family protein [Rothia santali]MCP3425952.1 NAD-dependent epimerase/dehydratase family protein [Rothia santali]
MSQSTWRVLGATGFTGSAIMTRLQQEGISAAPVAAPRLATSADSSGQIIAEARRLQSVIDYLADTFAGAEVVVNAAGLSAPDQQDLSSLIGANALLPAVVAVAAQRTGVQRVIHLSSAAVQGSRPVLDSSEATSPFSAYSFSKALGEDCLLRLRELITATAEAGAAPGSPGSSFPAAPSTNPVSVHPHHAAQLCIVRATSVQGSGRNTTASLARVSSSFLASVAGRGDRPTPVTSVHALAEFVVGVGTLDEQLPPIVLQPWEGATTGSVIRDAGRRRPHHLPDVLARAVVGSGYGVSSALNERFHGAVRRLELMLFGQGQDDSWVEQRGLLPERRIGSVLRQAHTAAGSKR